MSLLTHQSFANDKTPYWLSNPVEYLRFAGTPPVDVSNNGGELFANGVSLSPATWFNYPANGVVLLDDDGDRLQIISNDLYFNSNLIALAGSISNVSDWYLYPALSNVGLNAGVGIDFDGRLLSRSGTDLFFGGVNLNSSTWATYPATGNVNMSNFSLSNLSGFSSSSNFAANVASNYVLDARTIKNTSFSTISNECTIFNVTTDTINPLGGSKINLIANNGSGGEILLNAKSSITNSIGGKVSITADGGSTGGFVYGGLVEITANTGGTLPTGFTSAIKMSAASILSYAGAVSPFASVAGYNFVYGTAGVNIIAGVPSVLPNVPGSIFMTGDIGILGSSGGVRIKKGVSVDFITPLPLNGDLIVSGNPAGDKVQLSNVRSLGMEGDITGLGSIGMSGNIGGVSTIAMSNVGALTGVSTINGFPYNPVRNWANFPAISSVDISGNRLLDVSAIEFGSTSNIGFNIQTGFLGVDPDCVGVLDGGGASGDMRLRELVVSAGSGDLADDLKMTSAWNYIDGVKRIGVVSDTFAKVLAYLDDVPTSRGSMSSSVTQGIVATSTPLVFTYTDFGTLIGITESAGQIYSTNGGEYLLTFCIQFARSGGGGGGNAVAEAWIRLNGTDVPNSNSRILLQGGSAEAIMTIPINVVMAAGDYVEVVYCATNTNVVAQAFPARTTPWAAPAIPSIIVNIDQVA
jgi:hypothetical protein